MACANRLTRVCLQTPILYFDCHPEGPAIYTGVFIYLGKIVNDAILIVTVSDFLSQSQERSV